MGRRRSTSMVMAGLVAVAGIAIYTLIEDSTLPHGGMVSKDNSAWQTTEVKNTQRVRPTPGALVSAIAPSGPTLAADSQAPAPSQSRYGSAVSSSFRNAGTLLNLSDQVKQDAWVRVSGSVVNVRSSPSVSAPRIGSFPEGTRLRVIERGTGWTKIEDPETGQSGWMNRDYLAGLSEVSASAS